MSHLDVIDRTVQKTHVWLNEIADQLDSEDPHVAYKALRGVLHTLRDHLPPEESANFAAQLPMLVRGLYYEGWRPSAAPLQANAGEEFLAAVSRAGSLDEVSPSSALSAVMETLGHHVTQGQLEDVLGAMPRHVRELMLESIS